MKIIKMAEKQTIQNFLLKNHNDLAELLQDFDEAFMKNATKSCEISSQYKHQLHLMEEIEKIVENYSDVEVAVKNHNHNEVKLIYSDEIDQRHSVQLEKNSKNKFIVKETSLPPSEFDSSCYENLTEVIDTLKVFVASLELYFTELNRIDRCCWVVDPVSPTLKDGYRRIVIDDRIWLHVEISLKGGVQCLKLLGSGANVDKKSQTLQKKLSHWDADNDILDNVMIALEIDELPQKPILLSSEHTEDVRECGICMSDDSDSGVALPLCPNQKCQTYFHNSCLYQWLIQCNGGLASKNGFTSGECPNCCTPLDNISEKI